MLIMKTLKKQLAQPKEIVGNFPGINLFDTVAEDNGVTPMNESLVGIREKIRKLGIVENDVAEAVKWSKR